MIFPPYGVIPTAYSTDKGKPADWGNLEPFDAWVDRNIEVIKEKLWPAYMPAEADDPWVGASKTRMEAMTVVDLGIVVALRAVGPNRPFDQLPDSPLRALSSYTHDVFFTAEDDSRIGADFKHYNTRDDGMAEAVAAIFSRVKYQRKTGNIAAYFKSVFQRPRAYQMAVIAGTRGFTWVAGKSSMTPSLPSGHCLQGLMGTCCVMDRILEGCGPIDQDAWASLEQFAVDIGDRRVMAGIHCPSDNIASWMLALDMVRHVFVHGDEIRRHLWSAIHHRSVIFRKMQEAIDTNPAAAAAYGPAWEELHRRSTQ
ncbi:MAG: hypothetical protein HYX27_23095 [Acidobacteria bacterium]|nr:hypothetical protein [Acidobacteriota bacterium]